MNLLRFIFSKWFLINIGLAILVVILSFYIINKRLADYTHHGGWFRAKTIHREGGATFSLVLTAPPDGTVIWAKRLHARAEDVVPAKADRIVGDAAVLNPTVLDTKSRWLEGIVMLGLVTGFVYLSF